MKKPRLIIALSVVLVMLNIFYASPVFAFSYSGYHWDTYQVDYDSEYYIPSSWQTPIANAAETWSSPSNFSMNRGIGSNYVNSWNYGATGWNGETTTYTSGYIITQCITNFNSYYSYDIETVALHEFGHWLMLNDMYGNNQNLVMYYEYTGQKRSLATDDSDGIRWIYGY